MEKGGGSDVIPFAPRARHERLAAPARPSGAHLPESRLLRRSLVAASALLGQHYLAMACGVLDRKERLEDRRAGHRARSAPAGRRAQPSNAGN